LTNEKVLATTFLEIDVDLRNLAGTTTAFSAASDATKSTPSYERGHYFDGGDYWSGDTFYLSHSFTVTAWVRIPTLGSAMTIFSKNKPGASSAGEEDLFVLRITDTKFPEVYIANGASAPVLTTTGTTEVADGAWTFIGAIVSYNPTAKTTSVDVRLNKTVSDTATGNAGKFYIEHKDSKTTIGALLDDSYAAVEGVDGWIFALDVYNTA
jgi:hypothetical protein